MKRRVKGQTTDTKLVLSKLKKTNVLIKHGKRCYRIEIQCVKLLQNMFNDRNIDLDKIVFWWTRKGRTIKIHFQLLDTQKHKYT